MLPNSKALLPNRDAFIAAFGLTVITPQPGQPAQRKPAMPTPSGKVRMKGVAGPAV